MARFAYDVNTRTRLIDVHKQFNGGLKTVDTDDALGSVYLRQAENVSLSEFGFIEKRYGTIKKDLIEETSGTLQGYWEFDRFAIYVINNRIYKKALSGSTTQDGVVTEIRREIDIAASPNYNANWRYPSTVTSGYYNNSTGFGAAPYGDMNAVNINNVLYIFTGKYPIYAKVIGITLYFFWFSVDIPTYDEVVVTGHNLLEDDYDKVYGFTTPNDYTPGSVNLSTSATKGSIQTIDYYPRLPFQMDGTTKGNLNFSIDYTIPLNYSSQSHSTTVPYRRLSLDSVGYRRAGAGATTFTYIDLEDVTFEDIDNDITTTVKKTLDDGYFSNKVAATNTEFTRTQKQATHTVTNDTVWYEYNVQKNFGTVVKSEIKTGTPLAIQVFQKSGATYDPTYTKRLFDYFDDRDSIDALSNPTLNNGPLDAFHTVTITPVATDGTVVTSSAITVAESNIVISNNQYEFDTPAGLLDNDTISGYQITLNARFIDEFELNQGSLTGTPSVSYDHEDFVFTLAKVTEITVVRNFSDSSNRLIDFSISDLLTGTFDFQITFKVNEYNNDDGLYEINEDNGHTFSEILYNVPITPEKLTDYEFFEGDRETPIWSCNKVMEHYGKLLVWGSTKMPTAIFYSFPDRPTYFPSKFYLDFTNSSNQPIEAVTPYMNILVAQTASQTFGIRGNSGLIDAPAPYVPFGINGTVGTIAYKSVRPVRNQLFFLSKQGIIALTSLYAVDENYNIKFVDRNIRNTVPQETGAVGIQFDNQYWLNFPEERITLRWYIDKKAWVKDVYQGWATDGFKGVFKYQIKNGNLEYITHPSDITGSNRAIYQIGIDDTIPTDLFSPISAKFETSFLNQNYPFHPKNYKEAKLDFTLQNEYNLGREAIYDSVRDTNFPVTNAGGSGTSTLSFNLPQALKQNHRYRIEFTMNNNFTHLPVTSILIEGQSSYSTGLTAVGDANNTLVWEFNITNDYKQETAIDIVTTLSSLAAQNVASIVVRDVTYDTSLAFSTYVISENQTLNFDNSPGYNQATVDVDLDLTLKGRLGDWTFGESDFGDKVTAVKTIKLSGKGYNAKVYVEDVSKSKWTLESLGLTYKMKRARSR